MKSEIERIQQEITNTVARVRAADNVAAQHEQEIRRDYDAAIAKKAAALDAGNMEAYRAAGMEAEARRLDLEFIEESKKKGPKPAATAEDNTRIRNALRAEYTRIRAEGFARLKESFTKTAEDCAGILRQLSALDELYRTWGTVVMREKTPERIVADTDRMTFAQMENAERAQLGKYEYIKGV